MSSKYSSEEERRAAQRELRRKRNAIIKELLLEHQMRMKARETEQRAEQRATEARPTRSGPYTLEQIIQNSPRYRQEAIALLVKFYYSEVKLQMDAYRLLQGDAQ